MLTRRLLRVRAAVPGGAVEVTPAEKLRGAPTDHREGHLPESTSSAGLKGQLTATIAREGRGAGVSAVFEGPDGRERGFPKDGGDLPETAAGIKPRIPLSVTA